MNILFSRIYENKNGTPLVILHGLLGMSDNWITLGKKFALDRPVHLLDMRNHGHSFHHEQMNYNAMAEDIKVYLDHHSLKKIDLLGHSMGGKVAMLFACKYPENVHKLVVADISPRAYSDHHQNIFKAINSINLAKIVSRKDAEQILDSQIKDFGTKQLILKNLYRKNEHSFRWRFHLNAIEEQISNIVAPIESHRTFSGKTLFVRGTKSDYIQSGDMALINKHFPNSSVVGIKNAAHWLHAEKPIDFYNEVVSFLNS